MSPGDTETETDTNPKTPADGVEGETIPVGKSGDYKTREEALENLPAGGRIEDPNQDTSAPPDNLDVDNHNRVLSQNDDSDDTDDVDPEDDGDDADENED